MFHHHRPLRMFSVLIDGPANAFCDNCGVVKSPSIPELMLMMKHNAIINYHTMREAVVAGILRVEKKDSKTNLADILTKVIVGQKRWDFCFHVVCVLRWCIQATAKGSHQWLMLSGEPPGVNQSVIGFIILCQVWCHNLPCQVAR